MGRYIALSSYEFAYKMIQILKTHTYYLSSENMCDVSHDAFTRNGLVGNNFFNTAAWWHRQTHTHTHTHTHTRTHTNTIHTCTHQQLATEKEGEKIKKQQQKMANIWLAGLLILFALSR